MSKLTHSQNPLSKQHFRHVVCRSTEKRKEMHTRRGVTWKLQGRAFAPLGHTSMMVMDGHPDDTGKRGERIDLYCVTAQPQAASGVVNYNRVRMFHDFARNPFEGAKGRTLDPRLDGSRCQRGDKPNASWLRLALELDRQMARDRSVRRSETPEMPKIWACFPSMDAIDMVVSDDLMEDMAIAMGVTVDYLSTVPPAEFRQLAAAHWPDLWVAPGAHGNDTSCWLIEHRFVRHLDHVDRVEDFRNLLGVHIYNPARDTIAGVIPNPVDAVATSLDIYRVGMLKRLEQGGDVADECVLEPGFFDEPLDDLTDDDGEVLEATPTEFLMDYDQAVDDFMRLRQGIREYLGPIHTKFTDVELNQAIVNPRQPLVVKEDITIGQLPRREAVREMRVRIELTRPLYLAGVTDDDLAAAVENPAAPLYASRQCRFQVLGKTLGDTVTPIETQGIMGRISPELWYSRGN